MKIILKTTVHMYIMSYSTPSYPGLNHRSVGIAQKIHQRIDSVSLIVSNSAYEICHLQLTVEFTVVRYLPMACLPIAHWNVFRADWL